MLLLCMVQSAAVTLQTTPSHLRQLVCYGSLVSASQGPQCHNQSSGSGTHRCSPHVSQSPSLYLTITVSPCSGSDSASICFISFVLICYSQKYFSTILPFAVLGSWKNTQKIRNTIWYYACLSILWKTELSSLFRLIILLALILIAL